MHTRFWWVIMKLGDYVEKSRSWLMDIIKTVLTEIGREVVVGIHLAQDGDKRPAVVNTARVA